MQQHTQQYVYTILIIIQYRQYSDKEYKLMDI